MTSLELPRILIVDHFDSYTLNLLSLLHPAAPFVQSSLQHREELTRRIAQRVVVLPHTHPLLAPDAFLEHVRPTSMPSSSRQVPAAQIRLLTSEQQRPFSRMFAWIFPSSVSA